MKLLFCFITFFILSPSYAQLTAVVKWAETSSQPKDETIYYSSEKKLGWQNFLGAPQDRGMVAAETVSGFGYNAAIKALNGEGEIIINVYCFFNKKTSWVKPVHTTSYILNHEQHHFDISYIASKIFIQKLQAAAFTIENYNVLLSLIYNESMGIMRKMQQNYDTQTRNGLLTDQQEKWNTKIDECLNHNTGSSPAEKYSLLQ